MKNDSRHWRKKLLQANHGIELQGRICRCINARIFQHLVQPKPQYAPHKWLNPAYGKKLQYVPPPNETDKLDRKGAKQIQSICGSFLYYARAVDLSILSALNEIATQQAKLRVDTKKKVTILIQFKYIPQCQTSWLYRNHDLEGSLRCSIFGFTECKKSHCGSFLPKPNKAYHGENNAPMNVASSAAAADWKGFFHNFETGRNVQGCIEV